MSFITFSEQRKLIHYKKHFQMKKSNQGLFQSSASEPTFLHEELTLNKTISYSPKRDTFQEHATAPKTEKSENIHIFLRPSPRAWHTDGLKLCVAFPLKQKIIAKPEMDKP